MSIKRLQSLISKGAASLFRAGFRVTLARALNKLRFSKRNISRMIFSAYSEEEIKAQREYIFPQQIKFSILVPLYNTPVQFLNEMIRSVQAQTYPDWELCLADGSDRDHGDVEQAVQSFLKSDPRIKYRKLPENLGISGNTNACIELAAGDYISLFDHDDVLHPAALYETMRVICEQNADFIYTDEAVFESPRLRKIIGVHFKPDFAPDNLRSNNYICHFSSFKRSVLERAGLFRSEYDGSQDHDMILRLTACAGKIVHIPKVLYFWRSHPRSVAMDLGAKNYAIKAGQNAVRSSVLRDGYRAEVSSTEAFPTIYRVQYELKETPKISIVILKRGEYPKRCVDSIQRVTSYPNYEIIVSERIDDGAARASGAFLVFLDGEIEIITAGWIESLLMYAQRPDVGAVGGMVLRPNRSVYHAGYILGLGNGHIAQSPYQGYPKEFFGYMGKTGYAQNVSAVFGRCMMVRRALFEQFNGFDPHYISSYADIDFCLQLKKSGYWIVWTPFAEFQYNGPKKAPVTKQADLVSDREYFRGRWAQALAAGDPFYNPNFSLEKEGYRIRRKK